jgi:hypothetical protein
MNSIFLIYFSLFLFSFFKKKITTKCYSFVPNVIGDFFTSNNKLITINYKVILYSVFYMTKVNEHHFKIEKVTYFGELIQQPVPIPHNFR